jgi:3-dehydroquinate synthase
METLTVSLGNRSYPIYLGTGILDRLPSLLTGIGVKGKAAIVTDSNVGPLYADRVCSLLDAASLSVATSVLDAGEKHKRLSEIERLCGDFLEAGLDRDSTVFALGGGVVGDVAGYAAAGFMRGIRYVQIPTTVVAQVDSSVGGKTGVNHPLAKNIIGAFHQPSAVVIDLTLLETLPDRELRAGLAEVIKHGVIADEQLFIYMEREARPVLGKDLATLEFPVHRSCEIKSAVVSADEREQGMRAILNYGHTFGHGIEAVTHYTRYLHGEAVALGMHAAAILARNLAMVDDAFVARQEACISAYGLPVSWPELPVQETLQTMRRDKKVRAGTMKFVLPDRIGHVVQRTDISEKQVGAALEALRVP